MLRFLFLLFLVLEQNFEFFKAALGSAASHLRSKSLSLVMGA